MNLPSISEVLYKFYNRLADEVWLRPGEEAFAEQLSPDIDNDGPDHFTTKLIPDLIGKIASHLPPSGQYALSLACKKTRTLLNSPSICQRLHPNPKPPTMINLNFPDPKFLENFKKIENTLKGREEEQPTNTKLKLKPVNMTQVLNLNQRLQLKAARKAILTSVITEYKTKLPEEIKTICDNTDSLTDHEIEQLEKYVTARDTLVIWEKIAKTLMLKNPIIQTDYSTSLEHICDKAEEFENWKVKNKAAFGKLDKLDLSQENLFNINALKDFPQLKDLALGTNRLQDLTPLAGLTNLVELTLCNNQIQDLTTLAGLKKLNVLDLRNNQIQDLTPLFEVPQLLKVYVIGNPISTRDLIWYIFHPPILQSYN